MVVGLAFKERLALARANQAKDLYYGTGGRNSQAVKMKFFAGQKKEMLVPNLELALTAAILQYEMGTAVEDRGPAKAGALAVRKRREGPEPGRGLFAGLGSPSDIVPWRETMKYVDGYFEVRNQCTFGKLHITFGYFSLLSYPFSVFNLHQKCISIFYNDRSVSE